MVGVARGLGRMAAGQIDEAADVLSLSDLPGRRVGRDAAIDPETATGLEAAVVGQPSRMRRRAGQGRELVPAPSHRTCLAFQ